MDILKLGNDYINYLDIGLIFIDTPLESKLPYYCIRSTVANSNQKLNMNHKRVLNIEV
jgi:hypothetical protein